MPFPRSRRSMHAVLVLVSAACIAALLPAAAAGAAVRPVGHLEGASQAANRTITIGGWAYDQGRPASWAGLDVYVDAKLAGQPTANRPRPDVNRAFKINGNHGFTWTFAWRTRAKVLKVYVRPLARGEVRSLIATRYLNGYRPPTVAPPGTRIITEARKYLGLHNPGYVHGGTSPVTGFDCSGYTSYLYRVTNVANLVAYTETQRRTVKLILASQARPGDLVFYMSGGTSYHVAIYAGNGMQYAAATEQDGIVYQHVWSSAVQYGTTWH
ncbi:MAG: hypothetical protein DLM58_03880 [Pseudonocardiales bacterium]|nr:MAG: hypothetical protein DLM58_03880 [Pseudonocardiales bacterium]